MLSKVLPVRRCYCVCGRPCGTPAAPTGSVTIDPVVDKSVHASAISGSGSVAENATVKVTTAATSTSTTSTRTTQQQHSHGDSAVAVLQLKVRALEKYKSNYELLCSQLAELNAQVGLQLQRHEVDVTTLQATIAALQTSNATLQHDLKAAQAHIASQSAMSEQDREYAGSVHKQLATVAALLKTAETRLDEQEKSAHGELAKYQVELRKASDAGEQWRIHSEKLGADVQQLRESQTQHEERERRLRKRHRSELKELMAQLEQLQDELETQRATTRQAKKQSRQFREERDALAKQLGHVQADGTHLTDVIECQRVEHERQEKKTQRWRKAHRELEAELRHASKELQDTEAQLVAAKEALVDKNAHVEALALEVRELKQRACSGSGASADTDASKTHEIAELRRALQQLQLQLQQQEHALAKDKKDEGDAFEIERRYRKELAHLRQLLSLNHERTAESSRDMQVLKQELTSVQQLLREYHRKRLLTRQRQTKGTALADSVDTSSDDSSGTWHKLHRQHVEKIVLQSAIMDQVHACAPSAS